MRSEIKARIGMGPASRKLSGLLRERIVSGEIGGGDYLPTVRELSGHYGLATATVWRALRDLEVQGLVAAEPRKGYRVLARANDPHRGCPLVLVLSRETVAEGWDLLYRQLAALLEKRARHRGWNMMTVVAVPGDEDSLFDRLQETNTWGLIVDSTYERVIEKATALGLPVVVIDAWTPRADVDIIVQDNFSGGWLAADHLLSRRHKRVGWLGPSGLIDHSRARYGGAAAALAEQGLAFCQDLRGDFDTEAMIGRLVRMLESADRPTAFLGLWRPTAAALAAACRQLRLKFGKDVEMVGWCAEEVYAKAFVPLFERESVVPAVVWSTVAMADAAIDRLGERRTRPDLTPVRIHVPVRLRLPD